MFRALFYTILLLLNVPINAHEAPVHEHTELIPIPDYSQPYGEASASAALQAVKSLLDSFDELTKQQFVFELDAEQRTNWSNLPAGIVERDGISVGEMSDEQRSLLFEFLSSSLSQSGYQNMSKIMAAEAFLSTDKRAEKLKWAPENYWFSIYGQPAEDTSWGWQFGGHHLGLNLSVEDNKIESMSPTFVGTEPAVFTYKGVDYEAVVDMHEAGFAAFDAMDESQKQLADAGKIPKDVLTGPGNDGLVTDLIGMSAAQMSDEQRNLLIKVIDKWVSIQPNENAQARMQQIEDQLDETNFAFTGSNEVNTPTYMRIQGPTLIIELLSTGGNVGESASGQGHYHTIYRNLGMDYGRVNE